MQKHKYLWGMFVLLSCSLYGINGYAMSTPAAPTDEITTVEPIPEAIDACAGKSEGNSCEYTKTGTKVAGVCQKSPTIVNDDTNQLICQ